MLKVFQGRLNNLNGHPTSLGIYLFSRSPWTLRSGEMRLKSTAINRF